MSLPDPGLSGQLNLFYETIREDTRIGTCHISLYLALLEQSARCGQRRVVVRRDELMKKAGISARGTYYRCLKDLQDFGYIRSARYCTPLEATEVHLRRL